MIVEVIKEFPNSTGKKMVPVGKKLAVTKEKYKELLKEKLVKPLKEIDLKEFKINK